jgi:hypothetical protein
VKQRINNIIVLCFIIALFYSCDKEKRFRNSIEGSYTLSYLEKNGIDLTSTWVDNYHLTFVFSRPEREIYTFSLQGQILKDGLWYSYAGGYGYSTYLENDEKYLSFYSEINGLYRDTLYPSMLFYPLIQDYNLPCPRYHVLNNNLDGLQLEYNYHGDSYFIILE